MTTDASPRAGPPSTVGATMTPLLRARGLKKYYPVRSVGAHARLLRAVDGVDIDVLAGQTVAIVGESGCGKSTTARMLLSLVELTAGVVEFDGQDLGALDAAALRRMRRSMQMIFQDPYASLNPRMTIEQTLTEPLQIHGVPRSEHRARVGQLLERVGLSPSFSQRYPHEFSGGQRQRIGIARALAVNPRLIVCDEPVSALDVSVQAQVLNLLKDLQDERRMAYVFIAHDLAVVRHLADSVAVMYLGKIVERGPAEAIFQTPRHPYTRALLAAAPDGIHGAHRAHPAKQRTLLEGEMPSPLAPPSGCRFRTRCPFAQERCALEEPLLTETLAPVIDTQPSAQGHAIACHFWSQIRDPGSDEALWRASTASDPLEAIHMDRLRALQSAFLAPNRNSPIVETTSFTPAMTHPTTR